MKKNIRKTQNTGKAKKHQNVKKTQGFATLLSIIINYTATSVHVYCVMNTDC